MKSADVFVLQDGLLSLADKLKNGEISEEEALEDLRKLGGLVKSFNHNYSPDFARNVFDKYKLACTYLACVDAAGKERAIGHLYSFASWLVEQAIPVENCSCRIDELLYRNFFK